MVVLKIIGRLLLVPVWIIIAIIWLMVKAVVAIYSFTRGILVIGLGVMILGTIICYQDWKQVILLLCISGISILLLFIGIFLEISLDFVKRKVGQNIIA